MMKALRPACALLFLFTLLLGGVYPAAVWILGQLFWPAQAEGSLLYKDGQIAGSALIAQPFTSPKFFHLRPSATNGQPYNALASGASNLAPSNPRWKEDVLARRDALLQGQGKDAVVPVDLLTASGSGLDPHLSPEAAQFQAPRVAKARGLPLEFVEHLIAEQTEAPSFGFLGQPRVNGLLLNLALERLSEARR